MLTGSLADKIILFALPLAATSILQQLFNAADLAVVGNFASAKAMAAVGSNAAVVNLIIGLFIGLAVGANVLIASLIGTGHKERINDAVHTVIAVGLISGLILIVLGIALSAPILRMMGAPRDVMDLAILYLRIYFLAMPAIMVYNFGSAILRSKGDSKRPLYALILSGVINIILNLFLVVGFHLHVIGVATATVISNMIAAGLILYYLSTEEETFRLDLRRLTIQKVYLRRILQVGLPAGLQGVVFSLSNVIIQSGVNSFGADAIAGSTAVQYFDFICFCIVNSMAQTAVTFTSQNFSARKYDRCKKIFRLCMIIGVGCSVLCIGLLVGFRYQVLRLFSSDPDVIDYAIRRIFSAFITQFLINSYEISGGCLRGMNHSLTPSLISILGTCGFRLAYIFIWFDRHHTFETLFHVYPFSWIFTGTLMLTAYFVIRRKEFNRHAEAGSE